MNPFRPQTIFTAIFLGVIATAPCCAHAQGVEKHSERVVQAAVVVNATPAEAYRAWTTHEGITSFFSPGAVVEAVPGGKFEIHFNPYAPPGQRGGDGLAYLALQPDRMVSFTWNAPPSFPSVREQRTVVVVRFHPQGEKQTRVTLNEIGWGDGGEWDSTFDYFANAWPRVLANLRMRFEKGPIDWTPRLEQLKREMEKVKAKGEKPGKSG